MCELERERDRIAAEGIGHLVLDAHDCALVRRADLALLTLGVCVLRPHPLLSLARFVVALNATAETAPGSHWIVLAASAGSLSSTCNVSVAVANVNDPTLFDSGASSVASVSESAISGALVVQLAVVDPDQGQPLSCSVASTTCVNTGQLVDVQVRGLSL